MIRHIVAAHGLVAMSVAAVIGTWVCSCIPWIRRTRSSVSSPLGARIEGLEELNVPRQGGERPQRRLETVSGRNRARVQSSSQRDVQAVIHRSSRYVGQNVRVSCEGAARDGLNRDSTYVRDETLTFLRGQLLAADLLPDRVRGRGEEQVRREVLVGGAQQTP